jgi:hypothetical protein
MTTKAADFSYITGSDGFTSVMPNTIDAEREYNRIMIGGAFRLMPHEFAAFKSDARAAGYTVRKAKTTVSLDEIIDVDLLLKGLQ